MVLVLQIPHGGETATKDADRHHDKAFVGQPQPKEQERPGRASEDQKVATSACFLAF